MSNLLRGLAGVGLSAAIQKLAGFIPNLAAPIASSQDIRNIGAEISKAGGLARPNRFRVLITPPRVISGNASSHVNYFDQNGIKQLLQDESPSLISKFEMRRLSYTCQMGELPGKSFSTRDVRTYGSYFKVPYVDTYADITLTFLVGMDMIEKHFFDAWMNTIQDPATADFNYVDEYATTIEILQLSGLEGQDLGVGVGDEIPYGIRMYQAWPISVGELKLDHGENNTFHKLSVTFTYRKWVSLTDGMDDINSEIPTRISGSGDSSAFSSIISSQD